MRFALPAMFAAYLVFATIPALASPMNRLEVRQCAELSVELSSLERGALEAQSDVNALAEAATLAAETLSEAQFQASMPSRKRSEREAKAQALSDAETHFAETRSSLDAANAEVLLASAAHADAVNRFNRQCASRSLTSASIKACDAPDLRSTPYCEALRGG